LDLSRDRRFWRFFERNSRSQHLTKDQLAAKAAREACGKRGEPWKPRRRNRKRAQPSLP